MPINLPELERMVAKFDDRLKPVARRSFDFNDPEWKAKLAMTPDHLDETGVRAELVFSILDQGRDTRDAILWLQDISAKARSAGIRIKPILEEVAGLSSGINKYGMGSTKGLLLNACRQIARPD